MGVAAAGNNYTKTNEKPMIDKYCFTSLRR